ncbi:hypothetical protein CCMSSC00406_0000045 [Pleurotus cornucopiae]|uniref:Uncharacterized protein n=1 Tax=Pleurotus cornucopiae TaxID=5321 RepID=A0ACB7J249_PLECO|nr:hypothetical protein CCMSSC00406_0000045 [Pleurotus cornucopiae]
MSSSEGENFDFDNISDGSDSEGYAPAPKATKSKSAPRSKATTTKAKPAATKSAKGKAKQVLVDHDDNAEDSAMDVDAGLGESEDDVPPLAGQNKGPSKKKTASETYQKLSQLEHILKRPDSYIGSIETITQAMWIFDADAKRMVHREVKYVPGFFKIVDEILVNAADNKVNDPTMDSLKVTIDIENCTISVYNNGKGIPVEMHTTEKMYIPELIFGHLLSSSNYDDDEKKLTGGRNGYGAKLANIYSLEFTIETADKVNGKKYSQTWTKNMTQVGKAKITKNSRNEEYTRVTFKPELTRFGMTHIDPDTAGLLRKRVYDMAGTVKDVKVYLNDERLKIKTFKQYVEMYIEAATAGAKENSGGAAQAKPTVIYEQISPRWEVAFATSDGTFQQVSFANSISTIKGGTHVNYIADQLSKSIIAHIAKKNKAATVKPAQVKNHMWIFVNALIENPTFDSQTKETLTLPAGKFGSRPALSEEFMKKVQKSSIIDQVLNWAKFKADQQIKKTDGSKRNRLTGMAKLSDANNAGTKNAEKCTLILTEGDSAKSLAVAGLAVVGRDNFGVFPLRGKLLNVREARHDQIMKNEEIQNIKKIMGLQHNKEYTNVSSLRYGRLMIMTDQDHDGSHIKGLLINFLDHFYPSLLKVPEFLVEFVTPIVRVTKGNQRKNFFTIPEYETWLEETPDSKKWTAKYYKGLGTSSDADAREYFSQMGKHMIPFATMEDEERALIDLAFSKKKADDRKEWLRQFKPGTYLDHNIDEIPFTDFINKELILFSMADNIRSIPSVADGLKPGQRKVIWGCFKRKLKKEIKVAQLVGYISEHAAYHHGEMSLSATIVNLAQNYVGSNNINLLSPNGQYGTRDQGGKDHASPRYIYTEIAPLTRLLCHPSDDPLLKRQTDDNLLVEPEWYLPIIPMVLVNGAEGIGTGWSTTIPCYNPVDIVANIRRLMNGEEVVPMLPWWRGFKGEVKMVAKHKYDVTGIAKKLNDTTVEITELPIYKWTQNFKAELEGMIGEKGDGVVKDYKEYHDNLNVHYVVTMPAKELEKAEQQGLIEFFKLTTKINTSNMMCFDFDGKMKKYDSPEEILEEFYPVRLAYYQKRKDFLANELQTVFERLSNQARFIQMIVDKQLSVSNRKKADIIQDLRKHQFRPFPKISKAKAAGELEEVVDGADEPAEEEEEMGSGDSATDFDYLLGMAIYSLTKEKIGKLRQQANEKELELMALLEKKPSEMWNEDLDRFLEEWHSSYNEWLSQATKDASGKTIKKRQAVLETRKSITGFFRRKGQSDDDDDFKPTKAAAKKKAAAEAKKPEAKKKVVNKSESDDDDDLPPAATKPTKRKPASKAIKDEASDVDVDVPMAKPTKRAPARKPAKVASLPESDEDEPVPKTTARKASSSSKKATKVESDDESDFEIIEREAPKPTAKSLPVSDDDSGTGKGKGKAKAKRKRQVISMFTDITHSDDGQLCSLDDDESNDDEKPVKKKKLTPPKQKSVADFFNGPPGPSGATKKVPEKRKISQSMKPASPPKPKPKPAARHVVDDDDDNDDDKEFDDIPKPPARAPRGARAAAAKPAYIEIGSDEDDGAGDDSLFVDDD